MDSEPQPRLKARQKPYSKSLTPAQLDGIYATVDELLASYEGQRLHSEFGGSVKRTYEFLASLQLTLRAAGFPLLKGGTASTKKEYRLPGGES